LFLEDFRGWERTGEDWRGLGEDFRGWERILLA
jgi:hypothetical protein